MVAMENDNGRLSGTRASNPPPELEPWMKNAALRLGQLGNEAGVYRMTLIVTREGGRNRQLVRQLVVERMDKVETLGRG